MANAVRALLDIEGPSGKMALWAENGHVAREAGWFAGNVYRPMGNHLAQALGDAMVVFGFAAGGGSFQAMDLPVETGRGVIDFTVPTAPPGTLDGALASLGLPLLALDMRRAPREGTLADWLGARLPTRDTGCCFADAMASQMEGHFTPRGAYDALLFVQRSTAARPNPGGRPPLRAKLPTEPALRNGGMEEGAPGEPPAGWQASLGRGRPPYEVLASTLKPKEGKRCAMIAREKSPLAWGVSSLRQKIDAAPFRGKRVRFRAAVRAEVSGAGHEAHLYARVAAPGASDSMGSPGDGTLAIAGTFDRADRRPGVAHVRRGGGRAEGGRDAHVGAALSGNGKAFVDDVSLTVIGDAK